MNTRVLVEESVWERIKDRKLEQNCSRVWARSWGITGSPKWRLGVKGAEWVGYVSQPCWNKWPQTWFKTAQIYYPPVLEIRSHKWVSRVAPLLEALGEKSVSLPFSSFWRLPALLSSCLASLSPLLFLSHLFLWLWASFLPLLRALVGATQMIHDYLSISRPWT